MKGQVYIGELISFDTDEEVIELFDKENQEPIRIDIGANVVLPRSYQWKDLLMEEIEVAVIDGVNTRIRTLISV